MLTLTITHFSPSFVLSHHCSGFFLLFYAIKMSALFLISLCKYTSCLDVYHDLLLVFFVWHTLLSRKETHSPNFANILLWLISVWHVTFMKSHIREYRRSYKRQTTYKFFSTSWELINKKRYSALLFCRVLKGLQWAQSIYFRLSWSQSLWPNKDSSSVDHTSSNTVVRANTHRLPSLLLRRSFLLPIPVHITWPYFTIPERHLDMSIQMIIKVY